MTKRNFVVVACAVLVSACGGGGSSSGGSGGGSGGGSLPPANSWLKFSTPSLVANVYEGRSQEFEIRVTSTKVIPQKFNIGILESKGLISPKVQITALNQMEYLARLSLAGTIKPGTHQSQVEVRLCEDDPLTCAKPIEGSPWYLPLNVEVKPGTNLTPVDGAKAAWLPVWGDAARTRYVPGRFDPAKFTQRWRAMSGWVDTFMVADGTAVFNTTGGFEAIRESDGAKLWSVKTALFESFGRPAIANGKVFANNNSTSVWAYDQKTGVLNHKTELKTSVYGSREKPVPLAYDGALYLPRENEANSDGVSAAHLSKLDAASGQVKWSKSIIGIDVLAYGQNIYALGYPKTGGTMIEVLRAADGQSRHLGLEGSCKQPVMGPLAGRPVIYLTCGSGPSTQLRAIDADTGKQVWSVAAAGSYSSSEYALAGATLYAVDGEGRLEARSTADGKLNWSVNLKQNGATTVFARGIAVTDNMVFVATDYKVLAIDMSSQQVVWSYPIGGAISLSPSGILFIHQTLPRAENELIAINLR